MKQKIAVLSLLIATTFFWLPSDSYSVSAQPGKSKVHKNKVGVGLWQPKKRGRGHYKPYRGYKNYGQWRRAHVGNRRFHLVKRYYWHDGRRLSRLIRIYY